MASLNEERFEQLWYYLGLDVWAPFRVIGRLSATVLWVVLGLVAATCVVPLELLWPSLGCRASKAVSRTFIRGVLAILGVRIVVRGNKPTAPFFLVGNHISWIDFLVTNTLVDAVCVTESIIESVPLARHLLRGMNLIIVRRKGRELMTTNAQILTAMQEGKSIVLAPEATVSPGLRVCHFHSALLDPAVRMGKPVQYASLTVRTPEGCPRASQAVLTPDPDFPSSDCTDEELARWGEQQGFFRYLSGLLSLPYIEYVATFADEPIVGTDRKTLARDLQRAVQSIFVPVE